MSNNNIIDGSGSVITSFLSTFENSASWLPNSVNHLHSVATYGDYTAVGLPYFAHSPDPGGVAEGWGSLGAGTTISPSGNNGKAFLYNKSTDTTIELVQPSADITNQGYFGYHVAINDTYVAVSTNEQSYFGITAKVYIYNHAGVQQVRIAGPQLDSFFGNGEHTSSGVILGDTYIYVLASRYSSSSSSRAFVYDYAGNEIGYVSAGQNDMSTFAAKGNTILTGSHSSIKKWNIAGLNGGNANPEWSVSVPSGLGSLEILDDDYFLYTNYAQDADDSGYMHVRSMSDGSRTDTTDYRNPDGDVATGHFGNYIAYDYDSGNLAIGGRDLSDKVYLYSHSSGVLTYETSVSVSETGSTASSSFGHTLDIQGTSLLVGDRSGYKIHEFTIGNVTETRAITVTGDVQQGAFSPYVAGGYSTEISSGYVGIAASSDFAIGAGDFTFETWVKVDTDLTGPIRIFALDGATGESSSSVYCKINASSVTTALGEVATSVSFNDKDFHHVAVSRSSGTTNMFVDGVQVSSVTDATSYTPVASPSPRIMNGAGNITLSNMRLVKGVGLYPSAFTPPTEPLTLTNETVLLTCNQPYMSAVGNEYSPAGLSTSLAASFDGSAVADQFGFTTAISPNGNYACAGFQVTSANLGAQRIRVYDTSGATPVFLKELDHPTNVPTSVTHFWENVFIRDNGEVIAIPSSGSDYYTENVTQTTGTIPYVWVWNGGATDTSVKFYRNGIGRTNSWERNVFDYDPVSDYLFMVTAYHNLSWPNAQHSVAAIIGWDMSNETDGEACEVDSWKMYQTAYNSDFQERNIAVYGGKLLLAHKSADLNGNGSGYAEVMSVADLIANCGGSNAGTARNSSWVTVLDDPYAGAHNWFGCGLGISSDMAIVCSKAGGAGEVVFFDVYDLTSATPQTSIGRFSRTDFEAYAANDGEMLYFNQISIRDNYLFLQAPREDDPTDSGRVYILDKSDYSLKVTLTGEADQNDFFGRSHSVSSDASKLLVGASERSNSGEGRISFFDITEIPAGYSSVSRASTPSGAVSTERFGPFDFTSYVAASHGGSAVFDGSEDKIIVNNLDVTFTGDYTIEAWVYPKALGGDIVQSIITFPGDPQPPHYDARLRIWKYALNVGTPAEFLFSWGDGTQNLLFSTTKVSINQWYHIAISRSSGTTKMFVNGTEEGSTAGGQSTISSSGDLLIGASSNIYRGISSYSDPDYGNFTGVISDVRITTNAEYIASFTPPTAPLAAVTGTTLLLPFDDATIVDKSGSGIFELKGAPTITTADSPYGPTYESLVFDGSADYIEIDNDLLEFDDNFTIEAWIKPTASAGQVIELADGSGIKISTISNIPAVDTDAIELWVNGTNPAYNLKTIPAGTTVQYDANSHLYTNYNNGGGAYTRAGILEIGSWPSNQNSAAVVIDFNNSFLHMDNINGSNTSGRGAAFQVYRGDNDLTLKNLNLKISGSSNYWFAIGYEGYGDPSATITFENCTIDLSDWLSESGYLYLNGQSIVFDSNCTIIKNASVGDVMSAYVNYGTITNNGTIVTHTSNEGQALLPLINSITPAMESYEVVFHNGSSNLITSTSSYSTLTWKHVAVSRRSSVINLFVDGTTVGSASSSATIGSEGTAVVGAGAAGSDKFAGLLSDIRISSNNVYYSDFTAPNAPLTLDTAEEYVPYVAPVYNDYAADYVAQTSGQIVTVENAGSTINLDAAIDSMSDGDALLLDAGEYQITTTVTASNPSYSNDILRGKNIAIVGKTENANDVVLTFAGLSKRDTHIFPVGSNYRRHFANVKIEKPAAGTNYSAAVVGGATSSTVNPSRGSCRNVIIDFSGGHASWKYNSSVQTDVLWNNVSFVNYAAWYTSYSSSAVGQTITNCSFEGVYQIENGTFEGTNYTNVSFDSDNLYAESSTSGHLFESEETGTIRVS